MDQEEYYRHLDIEACILGTVGKTRDLLFCHAEPRLARYLIFYTMKTQKDDERSLPVPLPVT